MNHTLDMNGLNDGQKKAVLHKDGPALVVSVAGSGKTRVLTYRSVYLIREHKINPSNILLTTFSRKATDEMTDRLKSLLTSQEIKSMTVGTFHSVARSILKNEYTLMKHPLAEAFSYEKNILVGAPQRWCIEEIMVKQLGMDLKEKHFLTVPEVISAISTAKNELIDVKTFCFNAITKKDFKIADIYRLYEDHKNEEKIIDFDDMIINLYKLFVEHPEILSKYQKKFKYILVDEAQDNNYAQYKLIDMLIQRSNNVFLVGDDDQSMYRFRGARPDQFIKFGDKQGVEIITLGKNYRSTPGILEVANELISKNQTRLEKKLIPFLKPSAYKDVEYFTAESEETEAQYVVENIMKEVNDGNFYSDCAVIYRTNAQSRSLEDYLIQNSIPYVIHGGVSFYERKEVKDLVSYMQLAVDPNNNEAFERVVNTPTRYLGKVFIQKLKAESKLRRCSLFKALKTAKLTPQQHRNGMEYMKLIEKLNDMSNSNVPTHILLDNIIKLSKYDEYLRQQSPEREEDNDVMENVDILKTAVSKHGSTKAFLNFLSVLMSDKKENKDAVQLMTIHRSKGLEFPCVWSVGFANNILPHRYALESGDPNAVEEERRLAYVALTRAQKKLYVTTPLQFATKNLETSLFVYDAGFIKNEELNSRDKGEE